MNKQTLRYEIAGLKVLLTTYYDKTRIRSKDYEAKTNWSNCEADIVIEFEHSYYEEKQKEELYQFPYEMIEYVYTGAMFNRFLLEHNGCMLHSSAVAVDDYGYLFSADSGTGKSTHTSLWLKHLGKKAFIINDDKPAIRLIDGKWYVYGTPWSGKTDQNVNTCVKLGAVVFLERSEENWIEPMEIRQAIPKFFGQTVRKLRQEENMDRVLSIMEKLLIENPIYKMGCNISIDAASMAYERIRRV